MPLIANEGHQRTMHCRRLGLLQLKWRTWNTIYPSYCQVSHVAENLLSASKFFSLSFHNGSFKCPVRSALGFRRCRGIERLTVRSPELRAVGVGNGARGGARTLLQKRWLCESSCFLEQAS